MGKLVQIAPVGLDYIDCPRPIHLFDGIKEHVYTLEPDSFRYQIFKKNKSCVVCGITGTIALLEKPEGQDKAHLNLYAIENYSLVLMTKDHIVPKSKGGKDVIDNFQTMCCICNSYKGNSNLSIPRLRQIRELRNKYGHLDSKKHINKYLEWLKQVEKAYTL